MIKILTKTILTFAISILSFGLNAQEWVEKMNDPNVNFYEVVKSYDDYFEGKSYEKGKGMKQFLRWKDFMEPRVYPSGNRIDPTIAFREKSRFEKENKPSAQNKSAQWQPIGPKSWQSYSYNPGHGRVNSVRVDPNDPNTIYVGTPAGGCWKTTDGGQNWNPLTDDLPVIGVSDIAIDPTNSSIVYLSTGDGYGGDTYSMGVLKSIDGGQTWNTTGLGFVRSQDVRSRKIILNPLNTDVVFVSTGAGLFKSIDAGANWSSVLSGDIRDVKMKPGDTSVVYASSDQFYKSIDGGNTFVLSSTGLSSISQINRLEFDVTPANPNFVYAVAGKQSDASFEGLYLSINSGATFTKMSSTPNIFSYPMNGSGNGGQSWYDLAITASDINANEVYVGGINVWKSTNSGANWTIMSHWFYPPSVGYTHADIHALEWYNGKVYCGSDGGIFSSDNNGTSWTNLSDGLQIMQFYQMAQTEQDSNVVMGGAQDNGCNYRDSQGDWFHVLGADGMNVDIDPVDKNVIYFASQNGNIQRSYNGGVTSGGISATIRSSENGAWVTPFEIDPNNRFTLIAGFENIWKSVNRGTSWSKLTNHNGNSTIRNLIIAPSNSNVIYYCANDNNIRKTSNGGTTWQVVKSGLPNLAITDIEVHPSYADSVWVSFSGYTGGNKVFVSGNGGQSWTNITTNMPQLPVNDLAYDTVSHILYIGTDIGVYYQQAHVNLGWNSFNIGLPNVVVNELEINYAFKKLRAATYGRGMWEVDIHSSLSTGINSQKESLESDYLISPNPTKDYITISWENEIPSRIRVIDIRGKELKVINSPLNRPIQINLSEFSSGIYFIEIQDSKGIKSKKIIKE